MPVPVFCCFWFQKSYTGNILGNGRDKNQKSYNCRDNTEDREGVEDMQQGGHTLARRGLGLDCAWHTALRRLSAYLFLDTGIP